MSGETKAGTITPDHSASKGQGPNSNREGCQLSCLKHSEISLLVGGECLKISMSVWKRNCYFTPFVVVLSLSHVQLLRPHGLQLTRPPCPSLSLVVCPSSRPLSQRCHLTISSSASLFFLPSIFPSIRVFSSESALCIRWPKYWSFSFSMMPFTLP